MDRASSGNPELPRFSDRLPDLVHVLRQTGRDLESARATQSYLPYWEDAYTAVHSLKGVLKILNCPEELHAFVLSLNDFFWQGVAGDKICRNVTAAGEQLSALAQLLDQDATEKISIPNLQERLNTLTALYAADQAHPERRACVPAHLFHVNEFVTKKAREVQLLNLNQCVVEDEILLDEIPLWRTQLNEALLFQEFGRGLVVNFLPFLSPEGSRHIKVWAWAAAASHSRAALKQRIKEVMPKVALTKL